MNKKIPLIIISVLALVVCSVLALNYWHIKKTERPEGYSKPELEVEITPEKGPVRITNLDIAENANKYFSHGVSESYTDMNLLTMVAFAPGSGWLRWQTIDGITPVIEFKKVTQRDIDRFNHFSKSINMPVRLALSGKVLKIWAEETQADLAPFMQADGTIKQYKAPQGFFKLKASPEVLVKKDKSGKVFIVEKKDKDKEKPVEAAVLEVESKK